MEDRYNYLFISAVLFSFALGLLVGISSISDNSNGQNSLNSLNTSGYNSISGNTTSIMKTTILSNSQRNNALTSCMNNNYPAIHNSNGNYYGDNGFSSISGIWQWNSSFISALNRSCIIGTRISNGWGGVGTSFGSDLCQILFTCEALIS